MARGRLLFETLITFMCPSETRAKSLLLDLLVKRSLYPMFGILSSVKLTERGVRLEQSRLSHHRCFFHRRT